MSRPNIPTLAIVLAIGLVASACSGGSATSTVAPTTTAAPLPTAPADGVGTGIDEGGDTEGPDVVDDTLPPDDPDSDEAEEPLPTPPADNDPPPTPDPVDDEELPDDLPIDDTINITLVDIEEYWARSFPSAFGAEFQPVAGFSAYDPSDQQTLPTCGGQFAPASAYAGNAFYCRPDDTINWDQTGLVPELFGTFGDFAVALVLAHEYGHAVQQRLNSQGPTILLELQADCLAGAWGGSVDRGESENLELSPNDLNEAIGGYLKFRDPLGTPAGDPNAHGSAFDRLSAFADGYFNDAAACPRYTTDPPPIADIEFTDQDRQTGGDLPLDELLPLLFDDLGTYWSDVAPAVLGTDYTQPEVVPYGPNDPVDCGRRGLTTADLQLQAFYCVEDITVMFDAASLLPQLFERAGDFAAAYPVVHSWSQLVLVQAGIDPTADGFTLLSDCFNGAFVADMFAGRLNNLTLSPGDLDEGVIGLALWQPPLPSLIGQSDETPLVRVASLRLGFDQGVAGCAN